MCVKPVSLPKNDVSFSIIYVLPHHEMSKNQAPHHSPDEPKSRALVLNKEGYSNVHVGELVGVSERTVRNWLAREREVARNQETPEMLDDWVRIVRRSQGMQHAVLDVAEEMADIAANGDSGPLAWISRIVAGKELLKHAMTYNIYAGTGTDKLQKEAQAGQAPMAPVVVIVTDAPAPHVIEGGVIEGESREVSD